MMKSNEIPSTPEVLSDEDHVRIMRAKLTGELSPEDLHGKVEPMTWTQSDENMARNKAIEELKEEGYVEKDGKWAK